MNIGDIKTVAALTTEAESLAKRLGEISMKLTPFGFDMRLTGWDWNRPGSTTALMPQGKVGLTVTPIEERPQR